MVDITYSVEIDVAKTDFASGALDVSARVLAFSCAEGAESAYELVTQPARLLLTLYNGDGAFFPDGGGAYAGSVRRGLLVRVRMAYGGQTQQLWHGWIESWQFDPNPLSQQPVVIITAIDRSYELFDAEYAPRLAMDVRVDEEIRQVLDDVLALPYAESETTGHILFDFSEFGTATFADNSAYYALEQAVETLDYTGTPPLAETETLNARQYIEALVAVEMEGLFWWSGRDGAFRFLDRHYYLDHQAVVATVGASSTAPLLVAGPALYGDDLINRATIHYTIRRVGTPNSVLYEIDEPLVLYGNGSREFTAQYRDPDAPNARVYGIDMAELVAGSDYTVNQISDGSGLNYLQYAEVHVEFGASSARVMVRNLSPTLPIWFTTFRLRGTPLSTYDRRSVTRSDADSIAAHGHWRYTGAIELINDAVTVEDYCNYLVRQRATPIMRLPEVQFNANHTATLAAYARDVEVGDRVRVNLTGYGDTGHDRQYTVVGLRYTYEAGGGTLPAQLLVSWVLRPAERIIGARFDDDDAQFDSITFAL